MRTRLLDARRLLLGAVTFLAGISTGFGATAAEPIKIGIGIELTGGLAATGKAVLLTTRMWTEAINAKGGLLGRPVEIVSYDDQSASTNVPGIYTKLLDIDKVDIVISGFSTASVAPAMPVIVQHGVVFVGLLGQSVNDQFHYDRYFSIAAGGPDRELDYSKGFFDVASTINPKPRTLAIVSNDIEYARTAADGARINAKKLGLDIVYDKTYPPTTADFAPTLRAVQAVNPDLVYVASFPIDSVGLVRAAAEIGLKAKVFGGGMIGMGVAAVKQQLGPLLNGVLSFDNYVPERTMQFPGAAEFLADYQKRAPSEGVDPLGFFGPPYAYARMQIVGDAIQATKSLDQKVLADYMHKTVFHTIIGDMSFDAAGEQTASRVIFVQYQGVAGNGLDQFKKPGTQVIVYPPQLKSGDFRYPYSDIKR